MEYYRSKYGRSKKKKKSKFARFVIVTLFILIIVATAIGYQLYKVILKPNTWVRDRQSAFLYVPTDSDYEDLKELLYENGLIINRLNFEWLAKRKNLPNNIHSGKYTIKNGMSNDELINLLRSGNQTPVKLIFNNIRTKQEFAQRISLEIEPDSADIIGLLDDEAYLSIFGFSPEIILTMFIPNTYEVYWNISARELMDRMYAEYNNFWNVARRQKADLIGLKPVEVSILASVVEKETNKDDEKPAIAGVYMNRLKMNWRLQADPTVVFAWGDFEIKRVLNIHKEIESPYNTYIYNGLPPGPICIPSIASIDAVLNKEDHKYLFFCAKDDFSGYHVFASSNAQHGINADKYRRALDERNIKK
jgi:UPF0755 protein